MIAEVSIFRSSWWKVWPSLVAGFCGPLLGFLLARWLPFHFAMGTSFFVLGFFAGLVFAGRSAPKWGLPRWLAAVFVGAGAGLAAAVMSFLLPF